MNIYVRVSVITVSALKFNITAKAKLEVKFVSAQKVSPQNNFCYFIIYQAICFAMEMLLK